MESLLASYGSDEEDADSQPSSPISVTKTSTASATSLSRYSIFGSLPPPRKSPEGPGPRTALFSSLPPPKNSTPEYTIDALADSQPPISYAGEKMLGGLLSRLPSGFSDNSIAFSPSEFLSQNSSYSIEEQPPRSSKLPLPACSKPPLQKVQKKVVEFKPPVNLAMVEATEEEELERKTKRSKVSRELERATKPRPGGLAAILPPPKNNFGAGAALGSHNGRRTVMETVSGSYDAVEDVNSDLSGTHQKVESKQVGITEVNVAWPTPGVSSNGHSVEQATQSSGDYHEKDNTSYYDTQTRASEDLYALNQVGSGDGYTLRSDHDQRSRQFPQATAFVAESHIKQGNVPVNALAEVMKERRKGREEPPSEMIEIRQADLTGGSKLREDQIRTTGIAFGPSYKPASSNKDKPSKLHRRKHQIGALYFDMKQNEMNLLDRRAKGNLTKAETQAKYGW